MYHLLDNKPPLFFKGEIAYFLTQKAVQLLVHFKFLRVQVLSCTDIISPDPAFTVQNRNAYTTILLYDIKQEYIQEGGHLNFAIE